MLKQDLKNVDASVQSHIMAGSVAQPGKGLYLLTTG